MVELWENCANSFASWWYNKFFKIIAIYGKKSCRLEMKKIYLKKQDILTKSQIVKIKRYWKQYTKDFDISFHKYYINRNNIFDIRYIPEDLFMEKIDDSLNNRRIDTGIADKNYLPLFLKDLPTPKCYIHLINGLLLDENYEIISLEKASSILFSKKKFIMKPSMTTCEGVGIKIYQNMNLDKIKKLLKNLPISNLVFQEVIEQSKETAKFHPESVNTIRIMTLILDNNVVVLDPILRIGVGKSIVDNIAAGGIYCGINKNGTLKEKAYDKFGNKYENHPDSGILFKTCTISFMPDVIALVKKAAQRFSHFRLIAWDITINKPIIIEANLAASETNALQIANGPLFGKHTDKILKEVFNKQQKSKIGIDTNLYI